MRKTAIFLLALALPLQAWALSTNDLLSTIAMPLAVAAVSNVAGVSDSRLADLVSALNQANVPPTQFVEVIRYTPPALNQPEFVQYVQTQASQGVTGDDLVNAIVAELRTRYNVTPTLALNGQPATVVVDENYVPATIVSVYPATSYDPLSLVGLPLAVAAVSDITGVSQTELANLVATLNNANVPPAQMVEVIRYAPPALIIDNGQPFMQYVQQQTAQGVTGLALVPVVVQQLQTYYPAQTQITVNASPTPSYQNFVPPVVMTRVEEVRVHPHGGPPGQIKKELGLQTGAEVVHGGKRGRQFDSAPATPVVAVPRQEKAHGHGKREREVVQTPAPMISSSPPPPKAVDHGHGKGHAEAAPVIVPPVPAAAPAPVAVPPGKAKGQEQGGPPGQEKPKGGKGHGKD